MEDSVIGLLHTQVGVDRGQPLQVILRGPAGLAASDERVDLFDAAGAVSGSAPLKYWGELWGSHWWTAEFSTAQLPTTVTPAWMQGATARFKGTPITVDDFQLFKATAVPCGPGQLAKRKLLASVRPGWSDAGVLWQLVSAHAAQVIGLCDLLRFAGEFLSDEDQSAFRNSIRDGLTYLDMCRRHAEESGFGSGALTHCLAKVRDKSSPYDSFPAALAFALGAEAVHEVDPELAHTSIANADRCLRWVLTEAKPLTGPGNVASNQGWPVDAPLPDSWPTSFLLLGLQAEVVLCDLEPGRDRSRIGDLTERVLARQIQKTEAEHGYWGHFRAYDGFPIAEKSWAHGMPVMDHQTDALTFGSDNGMFYGHPLFAFGEAIRRLPDHPERPRWQAAMESFGCHYFLPMCLLSPFGILPRGFFGESKPLWFAGVWHGCNATYGFAAAVGMELAVLTGDRRYQDIAYGNLQWIAGCNAGVTHEAVETGCTISSFDAPEGRAIAASLINGIGNVTAGCWTTIRGSICNGFGTGKQFFYRVPAEVAYDRPSALHDEDWITHNGAYLMGLARWRAWVR